MTVRELIDKLQLIENKELQVTYGYTEYDSVFHQDTYLWSISEPFLDIKDGENVINLGAESDECPLQK
jgi:hypothetical protein